MSAKRKVDQIIQELGKIPPQAIDLEEALLGSVMNSGYFDLCYKTTSSKEFYKEVHQLIFEAMEQLFKLKSPIDVMSVINQLRTTNNLEMVGGPYAITQLANTATASKYNIDFYARIIHQKYISREIIRITSEGQDKAFDNTVDVYDVLQHIFSQLQATTHVNYIDYPKVTHYERIMLKKCILDSSSFLAVSGSLPDYFFVDQIHQIIWNILIMLHDTDVPINHNSVKDILEESENKKFTPYLLQFMEYDFGLEMDNFNYIVQYLRKSYDRTQIFKLYRYLESARLNTAPEAIIRKIENVLDDIRIKEVEIKSYRSVLNSTLTQIISHHRDGNDTIIKTGYPYMDKFCKFSARNICVIGGAKGHGKTRYVIRLIYGMLKSNENIAAFLVTMEDPAEKIVQLFVSCETGLSIDQMNSVDHVLTVEERTSIKQAYARIDGWDLDFIDKPTSMAVIEAAYVKFAKKRPTKQCVFVLDNFMMLDDLDGSVKTEDKIAKRFPAIVQKTNGFLFVLHHFTKSQKERANIESGYRPEEEHLKGSTRIGDVAHYVLLMNLPLKYPDFMLIQAKKPMVTINGTRVNRLDVLNKLLLVEVAKHRDGDNHESERVLRFYPMELGTMTFNEWR